MNARTVERIMRLHGRFVNLLSLWNVCRVKSEVELGRLTNNRGFGTIQSMGWVDVVECSGYK